MEARAGDGRIVLSSVPEEKIDRAVRLPAVLWDRRLLAWTVPATPASVRNVERSFPAIILDGECRRLLDVFNARRDAIRGGRELGPLDLWRHQRQGIAAAGSEGGALLWHGMSAGKTRTVLELVKMLGYGRVLVLAPKFVVPAWGEQGARWGVDVDAIAAGSVREKTRRATLSTSPVLVVNHAASYREPFRSWAMAQRWDLIVVDEIQFGKSAGGVFSKFLYRLGKDCPHRLGLSGTPLPHSRMDAYGQMRFLDPGAFGTSSTAFRGRYAEEMALPGMPVKKIIGWRNTEDFDRRFWSITHHVPRECLSLPTENDSSRTFKLSGEARKVYNRLAKDSISEGITARNSMVKLLRLQQIANGFLHEDSGIIRTLHGEKAELLAEVLEELDPAEPVVIFARFHEDLNVIHQVCKKMGRASLELSGRTDDLLQWQSREGVVLAVQIQAGGVGIDLTRACHGIYYSLGYSLGDYLQSRARISRTNQLRPCTFMHLLCDCPAERKIYQAIREKKNAEDEVLKFPGEWFAAA